MGIEEGNLIGTEPITKNKEADRNQELVAEHEKNKEMIENVETFFNNYNFEDLDYFNTSQSAIDKIIEESAGSESKKDLIVLMKNLKDLLGEIKSQPNSYSRQLCDIIKGNLEEDARELSDYIRQGTRGYISRFLFVHAERHTDTKRGLKNYEEEPDIVRQKSRMQQKIN